MAPLLAEDELFVGDGGFPVSQVLEAQMARFVVRAPRNFTARRSSLPAYSGKGRPYEKGRIVRPLARTYRGKTIPATPLDHHETWREGERLVRADFWYDLVESDGKPGDATFGCVAIHDPRYREPLLLVNNLVARLVPEALHGNPSEGEPRVGPGVSGSGMRQLYRDRWPVEQMPLAAKQMLGAERSFVFGAETPRRLPDIALLSGAILMDEATRQPVMGTGFWDRRPQGTIGRLRRVLWATDFADWQAIGPRFRQKASPTAHLPKGVLGHRRQKPHEL